MAHGTGISEPGSARAVGSRSIGLPWAWVLLALALIGAAGSLSLSIGLKLEACPLCFYQRTFVMGVFAILGVGLFVDRNRAGFLCLLSLPLVIGGLGVAAFHEYLVVTGKLECPLGLLGVGTAPVQSLTIFVLLSAVSLLGAWAGKDVFPSHRAPALLGAVILGLLLAWGSVASAPPMPARTTPYDPVKEPLNRCRPTGPQTPS